MSDRQCPVVVGVFEDRFEAEKAVGDLEEAGFDRSSIGFALRGEDAVAGGMITDAVGTKDGTGAVSGMVAGGVTGGLLGALASLIVPGIGPVLAAGALATALGFAGAGAAVGGLLGAMTGLGVSEEEARYYEREFQSGKAIVAVKAEGRELQAAQILRRHGGHAASEQQSNSEYTGGPVA